RWNRTRRPARGAVSADFRLQPEKQWVGDDSGKCAESDDGSSRNGGEFGWADCGGRDGFRSEGGGNRGVAAEGQMRPRKVGERQGLKPRSFQTSYAALSAALPRWRRHSDHWRK